MIAPTCAVEVGSHEAPYWENFLKPGFIVCDRHKKQFDERTDLGPYDWVKIDVSDILSDGK